MIIEKKTWPKLFQDILNNKKDFDVRLADWKCKKGDVLLLKEWDPKTKKYTGRRLSKKVKYIYKFKLEDFFFSKEEIERYGLQIISFE